ncbi:MAG TPA: hypothetical protein DCR93_26135, partial [Cytophagales bacterium]|nr:hypothetical protein [Cytophagales bacterium]
MDKRVLFLSLPFLTFLILHVTCSSIHDIPIPSTARFEQNLSDYAIYQGEMKDLVPTAEYTLLELNSPLFSNYSKKQRLVRLPTGTQMEQNGSGLPTFPDGTVLVKTFFYDIDQRDELLGKQVIETRLEIKSQGVWNVGTYIWNDSLTEATLALDGFDKQVRWTDASGEPQVINYHFPDQRECVSCHQQHAQVQPIGPTLRNLNIDVVRDHTTINQLAYLQSHGLIHSFSIDQTARLPDYRSPDESL